jgi:type II secretory pathway pseudopilin PulG
MKTNSGFSLIELLVIAALTGLAAIGISHYVSIAARNDQAFTARLGAQQLLDTVTQRVSKDFERHSSDANSIETLPSGDPFITPSSGTKCGNLTIRQTFLSPSGGAPTIRKIEYTTACTGGSFPDSTSRGLIHSELNNSCSRAPILTRTTWQNEANVGASVAERFPGKTKETAVSICFRPDTATGFSRVNAEISVAYQAYENAWKAVKRTLNLNIAEMTAGIEILPPQ